LATNKGDLVFTFAQSHCLKWRKKMKNRKVFTPLPTMENIQSHLVPAMIEYYSRGKIGGCSNNIWPNEDTNKKLANCLLAKNRSQIEIP